MRFLVISEDTPYFQWQIELLIESFKFSKLEDKLSIYLIQTENSVEAIKKNINQHSDIVYYKSNKLKNGSVNFDFHNCVLDFRKRFPIEDFVILDTDMFLKDFNHEDFYNEHLTYQISQNQNKDLDLILNFSKSKYNFNFNQMTSVIYFNTMISYNFFESAFPIIEDLVKIAFFCNIDNEDYAPHYDLYKYAYLILALMYKVKATSSYKFLNYVYEGEESKINFISYKHDIKPYFYKKNYYQKNFKNLSLHYADPFENFMNLPDFVYCSFIKKIVSNYMNF